MVLSSLRPLSLDRLNTETKVEGKEGTRESQEEGWDQDGQEEHQHKYQCK